MYLKVCLIYYKRHKTYAKQIYGSVLQMFRGYNVQLEYVNKCFG